MQIQPADIIPEMRWQSAIIFQINRIKGKQLMMETGMTDTKIPSMGGMTMSMAISWQTHCVVFLFGSLHAKNTTSFFTGCFVAFLLAVFMQLLSLPRAKQAFIGHISKKEEENQELVFEVENGLDSDRPNNNQKINEPTQPKIKRKRNNIEQNRILKTIRVAFYYSFYSLLSLLVMLLAMTMNGFVILSVALGTGIGKTIVASQSQSDKKSDTSSQNSCY